MNCPECDGSTTVMETRIKKDGSIRRRRKCLECGNRFTTIESIKKELKENDDLLRTAATGIFSVSQG